MGFSIFRVIAVCLCLLAMPAAGAEITAEELVDRVGEALGGRERLGAIEGFRMESKVQGIGLAGRARTEIRFPDQEFSELQLGPLKWVVVLDGEEGWTRDHNGHVVPLTASQVADSRTSRFIDSFGPWLAPFDPAVIRTEGVLNVEGVECPVLRIQAPGGNPYFLAIDPRSYLPIRQFHDDESGLGQDVVVMADYGPLDGVLVPHLMESFNDQVPTNKTRYELVSLELTAPDDPALFLPPAPLQDVSFPDGVTSVTVPARYRSGHLFIDVTLTGDGISVHGAMLVDTGTTLTMLDVHTAGRLGLQTEGELSGLAVGGSTQVTLVQVAVIDVGGVQLENQVLGVAEFADDMERQMGVPVVGLLGYDFFSRFVVTLDFDAEQAIVQDANSWVPPETGALMPLTFIDQQPALQATLDGDLAGLWRLDTGADSLAIHGPAVGAWDLEQRHGPGRELVVMGMGGETRACIVRARSFALGPYVVEAPLLMLVGDEQGVLSARAIVGNLGNSVLDRFKVTVDFGGERIHLQPGTNFAHTDRIRVVDFDIGWAGTRVKVFTVEPGGEGYRLGLRAQQEVLRINGRSARNWTASELVQLWAGETLRSVVLVVRDATGRHRIRLSIPPPP